VKALSVLNIAISDSAATKRYGHIRVAPSLRTILPCLTGTCQRTIAGKVWPSSSPYKQETEHRLSLAVHCFRVREEEAKPLQGTGVKPRDFQLSRLLRPRNLCGCPFISIAIKLLYRIQTGFSRSRGGDADVES